MTWDTLYTHGLGMGLLPDQFWNLTFREFQLYREGFEKRQYVAWTHTSSLMALQANMNAAKGKRYSPDDFNPYVTIAQENEGIETKQDVLDLFERAKNM